MNKKTNLIGINIFVLLFAVIYALVLIVAKVGIARIPVAVVPGSYAESYAKDHGLRITELAESKQQYFDLRYEIFDYNVDELGCAVLENYTGQSTDLVIPGMIDGRLVTELGENFIGSLKTVKNLYLSPTIIKVDGEPDPTVTIHCTEDSIFYKENKDKGWNIELVFNSEYINYTLGDIPYDYNINGSSIEITGYNGTDEVIAIPSYINGYPVTDISMNLLGTADAIVIPETVKSITGISSKLIYSSTFAIELVFSILAFIIALITVDVLFPRYRKDISEYVLSGGQIVVIGLYVVLQTSFGISVLFFRNCPAFLALVVSLIILAGYVFLLAAGGAGRIHAKQVAANTAQNTSKMKGIKTASKRLADGIRDADLRKKVQRLVEEIRYSDPVSRPDLDDIESDIEGIVFELKKAKTGGTDEDISSLVDQALELLRERNNKCKAGK